MSVNAELTWFKSSHSNPDGQTCVEVAYAWRKSSYSGEQDADTNCVEVATTPTTIHIRDSKNVTGPALSVPPAAWADFLRLIS
ncbi:toxin [Streptomyces chrestomyceticus JCM 4735]|uniref:Toxin n=1 Tax=Streptomyces chrestomyceticus JCM 4735 TaxID=1306181 RepID=A0A7U9KY52_9ACTN|nr:toxin [Streptomyces chrestomyceticus JCM 4735]